MTSERIHTLLGRLWHGADYNYEQWLHSPEVLADDFRLMKIAGCTAMSVGIFSWSMIEPEEDRFEFEWLDGLLERLHDNDIRAILATPSAAHPSWMSEKYPDVLRVGRDGSRETHRARQNFCRTSPVFRQKIAALNGRLAERYGNHPSLLLWHVSNEYGSSACYCETCLSDFRRWLKMRYRDLDGVNRAWWTSFWSHQYTDWTQIHPVDTSNNGLMLDWMRYNSDQVLDFYTWEIQPLRQITPDVPITTNFMRPDVGLNYWKIADHVDVISWDSYPEWHVGDDVRTAMETAFYHDLHRSYKHGLPFYLLETSPAQTNWQPLSRLKRPGMVELASLQGVAHGALGVNYFQWRQSRGGEEKFHGAVVLSREGEASRTFQSVQNVGRLLTAFPDAAAGRTTARIGIVYDFENEWALNLAHMPRAARGEYQRVCIDYYQAFWRSGIPVDLLCANSDFSAYDLLMAPMLYLLTVENAHRFSDFVASGGTLLTTFLTGWVGESDLVHLGGYPGPLGKVLGVRMTEFDTFGEGQSVVVGAVGGNEFGLTGQTRVTRYAELLEPVGAEVLATYQGEFYKGKAALTANRFGDGWAVHVGAHFEQEFLDELCRRLVERLAIESVVPGGIEPGVCVRNRKVKETEYLFVMNFNDRPAPAPEINAEWQPVFEGQDRMSLAAYGYSVWKKTERISA